MIQGHFLSKWKTGRNIAAPPPGAIREHDDECMFWMADDATRFHG